MRFYGRNMEDLYTMKWRKSVFLSSMRMVCGIKIGDQKNRELFLSKMCLRVFSLSFSQHSSFRMLAASMYKFKQTSRAVKMLSIIIFFNEMRAEAPQE